MTHVVLNAIEFDFLHPEEAFLPVPTDMEKRKVKRGSFVRLLFHDDEDSVEPLWVIVDTIRNGRLTGFVNDFPYKIELEIGDKVWFKYDDIESISNPTYYYRQYKKRLLSFWGLVKQLFRCIGQTYVGRRTISEYKSWNDTVQDFY